MPRQYKNELKSIPFESNYVEKNTKATIRLAKLEVGDRNFMDIREFIQFDDGPKPSRKGVAIEFKHINEVIKAIEKIRDENISTTDDYLVVHFIEKGSTKRLNVGLSLFQEKLLVDIREFFKKQDSEEWGPTQKGIQFQKELIGDVSNLIQEFCEQYNIEVSE